MNLDLLNEGKKAWDLSANLVYVSDPLSHLHNFFAP